MRVKEMATNQLTLELDPNLLDRYRNVRDVVTAGVYQRGLKRIASDLDVAPGNLSCMLSDDSQRKLGTDDLERYIEVTGDLTPIHFLVSRYLGDKTAEDTARTERLEALMGEMASLLGQVKGKRK